MRHIRRWLHEWRPATVTGGAPFFPLFVLFGLNAVDELDRTAFGILTPEIRDHFGLDIQGILTLISVVTAAVILLEIPLAHLADRRNRVRIAAGGAAGWAGFSLLTGLAPNLWFLGVARTGSGFAKSVVNTTHNSLLADFYDLDTRTRVFSFHRAANSIGQFVGPLAAGGLAYYFGWRTPFMLFTVPTLIFVVLAFRLREPNRGVFERTAAGADEDVAATDEVPPSFAEAWRILYGIKTLRRMWLSLPFLAVSLIGIGSLFSLLYEEEFGVNELERGVVAAVAEPGQLVGILVVTPWVTRLAVKDPGLVLKLLAGVGAVVGLGISGMALAPNIATAVAINIAISAATAVLIPGLYAVLSLAIPPKVRSLGFSVGSLYVLLGLPALLVVGGLADSWGIRRSILMLVPIYLLGSFILASAGAFIRSDIRRVWTSAAAQAEVKLSRQRGLSKLLLVKDVEVSYESVQVLFGVNFEVDEGEIVALLGTNGAGKSTLLKAISGLVEAGAGAVVFDGRDMTYAPPHEVVGRGVVQVPGGKGVFPTLTVEENIRIAGWSHRGGTHELADAVDAALGYFPVLRQRWDQPAGNLSGGEQQMLTLAMAFIAQPRLLMIDELSLGLAPIVVEQLLDIVRAIAARGTTIILVEQSVNVALTVAQTAYFMEKGEIRFHGPTAELLERPDLLRSVFLEGASAVTDGRTVSPSGLVRNGRGSHQPGAKPLLEVTDLSKRFGGIQAVSRVTFGVRQGQILGMIGANGAGKTTIFDLVSGFLPLDEGEIRLGPHDLSRMGPDERARLGLGRSFQDTRLFPALTVAETIAVALDNLVEVKDPLAAALCLPAVVDSEAVVDERVDELIELMGLGAFRDKFVSELSTGSRRIVDLACMLAHEPQVLLLDEPSSGIAQREAEALGPLLLRIREATSASLLVIEHDMPLITSIADEIVALDLGRVIARGSPQEVAHDPMVVASYLGAAEESIARSGGLIGASSGHGGKGGPR